MKHGKKLLPLLLCLTVAFTSFAQERYTISGYIEDEATGEKLIGANVFDPNIELGTSTNTYGFYSLTLPKDSVYLAISYIGYTTKYYRLYLDKDVTLNFTLLEGSSLEVVEVTAEKYNKIEEKVQMSQVDIPVQQIKNLPALLGEVDILKTLQLLPGVQSGGEGTSGLYVRGGSPDQNLILLDGVPVYNVSHLFGFFSVFNADAIKNVTLTKGGFPARYGGRLSSVLEINMKEGNMKEFHGEGSVGIISSKLTLEGPIVKDQTSFIVSGRRTYIDILAQPFIAAANRRNEDVDVNPGYFFYDFNAKINHKFSDKDRLYLSYYGGDDDFSLSARENFTGGSSEITAGTTWGNNTAALRWNHQWSKKVFSNLTATYSKYEYDFGTSFIEDLEGTDNDANFVAKYFSGITDWGGKIDFDYVANPQNYIRFGANATHHTFKPGAIQLKIEEGSEGIDTTVGSQVANSMEYAIYVEDEISLFNALKMNVGVHASAFAAEGKTFASVQPRLGLNYRLPNDIALKASFANMTQYIHLLTNEGLGLPTDLWVPTTKEVIPEQSWQVALGFAKTFMDDIEFSIEGYYKEMDNIVSYKEGASFLSADNDWTQRVTQGQGKSYGGEFFLQKKKGNTTGWIGYTLSWTSRQFEEINGGRWYPFKYDRRHDVAVVLLHQFNERISVSGAWVYGTGNSITIPESEHIGYNIRDFNTLFYQGFSVERASNKNAYRMRPYHRFDISFEFKKERPKYERSWIIGAYNAYNRANPFFVQQGRNEQGEEVFKQYALFPLIPSIAYRFKF